MPQPVLVAGARTPIGKLLGSLSPLADAARGVARAVAHQVGRSHSPRRLSRRHNLV
jgi:hypothetical protein